MLSDSVNVAIMPNIGNPFWAIMPLTSNSACGLRVPTPILPVVEKKRAGFPAGITNATVASVHESATFTSTSYEFSASRPVIEEESTLILPLESETFLTLTQSPHIEAVVVFLR